MKRIRQALAACAAALLLGGCASYQMGLPENDAFATVYVEPVRNQSAFPMLEASLTSAIIKEINDTGYLTAAPAGQAQATLKTTVLSVRREIAAVSASDVGRGRKYELTFEIACALDKAGQPIFADRRLQIVQDVFADSGQINAEFQATPEASQKIARRVAEQLAGAW